MTLRVIAVAAALSVTTHAGPVPDAIDDHPRAGVMSEQVAREKLRSYGVTSIRSFDASATAVTVQADLDGRPLTLHIDLTRGIMRAAGAAVPLRPARSAARRVPRAEPREVRRLDEQQRHEQRPTLDRTPPSSTWSPM